jgi:hypothetical protein
MPILSLICNFTSISKHTFDNTYNKKDFLIQKKHIKWKKEEEKKVS